MPNQLETLAEREQRNSNSNAFQSRLQTGVQVVICGLLVMAGTELVQLGKTTLIMEERGAANASTLRDLRVEIASLSGVYYRQSEAKSDLDQIERRIDRLSARLDRLEAKARNGANNNSSGFSPLLDGLFPVVFHPQP